MASVPRGQGRAAMIDAAAESLLAGREVKVLDIAERAGVRHTLIYRHFPDGGRDELVAEAYAQLFRGQVLDDLQLVRDLAEDPDKAHAQIRKRYRQMLSGRRDTIRWSRLEALAKARANPYVADRLEVARQELIDQVVEILSEREGWHLNAADTRALAVLLLAFPLGATSMLGPQATVAQRNAVADMWAEVVAGKLTAA